MLVATYDEKLGLVRSLCSGFATQQEVDEYLAHLSALVEYSRSRNGRFLHLVDATEVAIQSTAVSEQLSARSLALGQEQDRTAIITTSALAKL